MKSHPLRAAGLGVLGLALLLVVGLCSLPVALAPVAPRLALALVPGHPQALIQVAQEERRTLNSLLNPPPSEASRTDGSAQASSGAAREAAAPAQETSTPPQDTATALQRLRADIRDLAARVIVKAPLEADAYRLLGEMQDTPDAARVDMSNAFALSRREPVSGFWLLNDAFERRDFVDALRKIDALVRTTPALNTYTYSYLTSMISDAEARAALVDTLRQNPSWRAAFFNSLGEKVNSDDGVLLFLALKQAGAPATSAEITPYLHARLYYAKDSQGSYNVWLQLLSDEELARLLPINNTNFASDPSGTPFDWSIARSNNVSVRLVRLKDDPQARAIRAEFGIGRIRFGGVTQVVFLRPGSYRFDGEQTGSMSAKRGMVWEVRCFPKNDLLGQSGQLFGSRRGWQAFTFAFTVPDLGCQTQIIRLMHDSRSPSEEYASGDIMFSKIRLTPTGSQDESKLSPSSRTR